ncbi:hypothetical protein AOLI_G00005190 [Acnodon oligacanthus]
MQAWWLTWLSVNGGSSRPDAHGRCSSKSRYHVSAQISPPGEKRTRARARTAGARRSRALPPEPAEAANTQLGRGRSGAPFQQQ